jgi:hypothetical protein
VLRVPLLVRDGDSDNSNLIIPKCIDLADLKSRLLGDGGVAVQHGGRKDDFVHDTGLQGRCVSLSICVNVDEFDQ